MVSLCCGTTSTPARNRGSWFVGLDTAVRDAPRLEERASGVHPCHSSDERGQLVSRGGAENIRRRGDFLGETPALTASALFTRRSSNRTDVSVTCFHSPRLLLFSASPRECSWGILTSWPGVLRLAQRRATIGARSDLPSLTALVSWPSSS